MGFRTVVMLSNDFAHEWQNDRELGRKIMRAISWHPDHERATVGGYGQVVECEHADCQTLAILDGYMQFKVVESQSWMRGESDDSAVVRLLKSAANKLGYRLVRKPT